LERLSATSPGPAVALLTDEMRALLGKFEGIKK